MKKLQDILKKKSVPVPGEAKQLDEKTLGRVFLEAAKEEIKNLGPEDIREAEFRGTSLYVKTAHPAVSSELFMRKEKILENMSEILGKERVEKIIIG